MYKEQLYEPYTIAFETLDEFLKREHEHNFFELVYILSGTGKQCINQHVFNYQPGHMFLLTPGDCHTFNIDTTTQFFFLRFTDIYIKSSALLIDNVQRLEFILQNVNHQPGCVLKNQVDKSLVRPMIEAIIREYVNRDLYNKEMVQYLVNTLIVVLARNIAKYMPTAVNDTTEEKTLDILQYIQTNICNPAKIRASEVSRHFAISGNYLSRYFKKHTNETMQQYIVNYRTRMVEKRLQHSTMRISEIAEEMGFTDESHLNKFFRKQKGISPKEFRKASRPGKINFM